MPMLGAAVLALMLMGMMKGYANLVAMWTIDVGSAVKSLAISAWKNVKSYGRKAEGFAKHTFGDDRRVGKRGLDLMRHTIGNIRRPEE